MKTIGMLAGMSWESSVTYYQLVNTGIKNALGGFHCAKIAMVSVDFADYEKMQHDGDWDGIAAGLIQSARGVEAAGADFLLICTNTMHKVAPQIEEALSIPLLHIADATGVELSKGGHSRVGLLGTAFTMEQEFYKDRIKEKFSIDVLTPDSDDRKVIHDIIYNELIQGDIKSESRQRYLEIIKKLKAAGAEAIVLGCTEIPLLLQQQHCEIPLFDTTAIHAAAAITAALEN